MIFAISLIALCMVAGIALTSADVNWTRTETLNALDAAVLAGAREPMGTSDEQRILVAQRFYEQNQAIPPHAEADVTIQSGVPGKFGTTETTVYGMAAVERPTPFGRLFGVDQLTVNVKSAATKAHGAPVCVLGLDLTEEATMDFNGKATLNVDKCAAMTNSSNSTGIRQAGHPSMKAAEIGVTGGYSGSNYLPEPMTGVAPFVDPYTSLPEPPLGACSPSSDRKVTNETVTLQPGTYCGGISLQAGSIVTMEPGIYVMKDGPLNIQAGAVVTGKEVMIAFLGPDSTLYLIGDASLSVTSPIDGPYQNIQFFGDRNVYGKDVGLGNSLWFTVIGNSTLSYDGTIYAPSFHLWFAGGSVVTGKSPSYIAVAKKLWFQDNTVVNFSQENSRDLDIEAAAILEHSAWLIE